ncbi:MAG TPA: LysR family transcriptional regulator [Kofleriaceae bacterium]
MEWDDVRVLLAVFRAKNLHDAGAQLDIDASTVSRRLANFENKVGAALFTRTRDGLRPTTTAERLRPHAERMETEAAALMHVVRAGETQTSGVVRVATTEALSGLLVIEGLLDLQRVHPDLVIELLGGNRPVDLARGDADIAVRLAALKQPSLRVRCVATMGVGLFAAPSYLRARGAIKTPASLRGHDVLLPTGELSRLPEARWLTALAHIRVTFRSNSMPALVAAAVAGHGIVPLPLGWGDNEAGLERVLVLATIPNRKVWLVMHEAASLRPDVRIVSSHIVSIFDRVFVR